MGIVRPFLSVLHKGPRDFLGANSAKSPYFYLIQMLERSIIISARPRNVIDREKGEIRLSKKVIAYDVGTTGLKTCMFRISAEESVQYLAGEVEHYELHVLENGGVEQ